MTVDASSVKPPAVELEYVPQPIPIYMLGESHCVVFTDRIFRESRYLGETFITRCMYLPGITSHDFIADQFQRVMGALAAEHLTVGDPRGRQAVWTPRHVATTGLDIPSVHSKQPRGVPVIVVFAGEIALRSIFLRQLASMDFELPFEAPGLERLPRYVGTPTAFSLVMDLANQVLNPLFTGLITLRDMGFTSLYLHSIPPPTLDDEEFESINEFFCPVGLRYKSAMLFNRLLNDTCAQHNLRFLNIWDEVTIDNQLNPEFHIDGTHLSISAAHITLEKLMDSVIHEDRPAVAARYEYARDQAQSWLGEESSDCDERVANVYQRDGVVVGAVEAATVASIRRELDFCDDTRNRYVRLDWNGGSTSGWPGKVFLGAVSPLGAELVYAAMYGEPIARLLRSCMRADYLVASVKALRVEADGAPERDLERPHLDGTPAGALRAVVYLNDVTPHNGPLQCTKAPGTITGLPGPAGTVIVFDGLRVSHRWIRPKKGAREVLDMVLIPRHRRLSRGVIWPGMNGWPVDPYDFSNTDFVRYPAEPMVRGPQRGDKWWKVQQPPPASGGPAAIS